MPTDAPVNFRLTLTDGIAEVSLDRPEKKNPLTFESYAELRDWFRGLVYRDDVKVVIFGSNGGNFCSGGDVFEIIGPLLDKDMKGLLEFTRMTGDLVKAIIGCGKPVIAAVDGICVGAGAIIAMSQRSAHGHAGSQDSVSVQSGRACWLRHGCMRHPAADHRSGRAADLLYTGRAMSAEEGERWGFYNRLVVLRP
jgi:enoyl-CoA hydratase/carnithine racemase